VGHLAHLPPEEDETHLLLEEDEIAIFLLRKMRERMMVHTVCDLSASIDSRVLRFKVNGTINM